MNAVNIFENRKRSRKGVTLIEVALAVGVVAIFITAAVRIASDTAANERAIAAAQRLIAVSAASKEYVRSNFTDIYEIVGSGTLSIPLVGSAITGAGPAGTITLPSLKEGGYLSSTFENINAFGQSHALIVKRVNNGIGLGRLEGIVTTVGGQDIADNLLGKIASNVGADGGFMANDPLPGNTGFITGTAGGWKTQASQWTVGSLTPSPGRAMATISFAESAVVGDYLNRTDIGIQEANTMRTDIHMAANDILGADRIVAEGQIVTVSPNLSVEGYITGRGNITSETGDIVATAGNVNAGLDVKAERNVIGRKFFDLDNQSYFVDPNETSRLANLNTERLAGSTRVIDGEILENGLVRRPSGAITTLAAATMSGTLRDRLPNYVTQAGYIVRPGSQAVPKPSCSNGGQQKVTFSPITDTMTFAPNVSYGSGYFQGSNGSVVPDLSRNDQTIGRYWQVVDSGATWVVYPRGTDPNVGSWTGLAMTYCYYTPV